MGEDGLVELRRAAPGLSSDEVALVLRRAADLDAEVDRGDPSGDVDLYDPAAVEEAALEVGLSRVAVRQALVELHAGSLSTGYSRQEERLARRQAVEARLVSTSPDVAHAAIERFLRRQMFARRRRQDQWAVYRRRGDLVARTRRIADVNGRIQLAGVHAVTVSVIPTEAASGEALHMVRLEAELGTSRTGARVRAVGTGIAVGIAVGAVGVLLPAPSPLVALAVGVGAGIAAALRLSRRWLRRRREEVTEVLAALLDKLD